MKKIFRQIGQPGAGRSAVIYALFGLIWILFSDHAVFLLFKNPEHWHLAQNLKGFLYILVTTLLVYSLIKKSISNIRQQEAKIHLLANNTRDVIWSLNMSRQITYMNPAIENIVGIKADELIGENVEKICTEKTIAQIQELLSRELQKGSGSTGLIFTAELLHKDGTVVPVEISGRIIYDENNQPFSIQGVSRDIRERYAMQAQLRQAQKMESIGTMASGIAHEINNPIYIISATAELLAEKETTDENSKELLLKIRQQSENIHQIVANLLGFVRVEEMPEPVKVPADSPLRKSLELANSSLHHDHILVETHLPEDIPDLICLPHQIQQGLLNLIQNAKDSLNERYPDSHPGKQLHLSLSIPDNKHICFTVEDLGTGMNAGQLEKLFDPFYTTKPEGKGTGLGMWILHQIIKNHRGRILVDSKPLTYTRIELLLPLNFQAVSGGYTPTIQTTSSRKTA